jgi:pimeloyl-ACP methyl ester carboxylesterase
MIPGAGGLGGQFRRTAEMLADRHSVILYDRRCHGRSTGDPRRDMDLAQQARDTAAVIRDSGAERAYVFGTSGGGAIACKLVEDAPEVVDGLVLHEPAIVSVLPDADRWLAHVSEVHDIYLRKGAMKAMIAFTKPVKGINPVAMIRARKNGDRPDMDFFLAHEHVPISTYQPHIAALRRTGRPMIMLSGRASGDGYNARTAPALAELLGMPFRTVSGNHFPYLLAPDRFAAELSSALGELVPEE